MPMRVTELSALRPYKAPTTGIYVGPDGDQRFYKAGTDLPPSYRFSHERTPEAIAAKVALLAAPLAKPARA